jgi:hypothetical protein
VVLRVLRGFEIGSRLSTGDPSLRLKPGSGQDDAMGRFSIEFRPGGECLAKVGFRARIP